MTFRLLNGRELLSGDGEKTVLFKFKLRNEDVKKESGTPSVSKDDAVENDSKLRWQIELTSVFLRRRLKRSK